MEFNPLDLLASAAELQQKQDDSPDNITMVTRRQRKNSATIAKPSVETLLKENTEVVNNNNNNNNNNSIKSKGITIIKKIKLGGSPEIEKMLNEHNYGNAKKSPRYEKNGEPGFEVSSRYQDSNAITGSRPRSVETKPSHIITTTFGRNGDKVSVISNSSSQVTDSECKCGEDSSSNAPGKGISSHTTVCTCGSSPGDKNSIQGTCRKCVKLECEDDCSRPIGELGMVDSQNSDKTVGQPADCPTVKQDCENKHTDKNSIKDTTYTDCPQNKNTDTKSNTCDMDTNISPSENVDNNIKNENENGCSKTEIKSDSLEQSETVQSETCRPVQDIDVKKSASEMVKCSVFTSDMMRINQESKPATSDRKKLPYVKVIPSKSNTELDKPQTLVINITSKTRNNNKIIQNLSEQLPSLLETDGMKTEKCEKSPCSQVTSECGVTSIVTTDKISASVSDGGDGVKSLTVETMSVRPRLDVSKCDTLDLTEKSNSYNSLKRLELSDSLCSDISSTSVHLLSPDRRNPDSMGIAESPVMTTLHELSGLSSERDGDSCDKNRTDTNCDPVCSTSQECLQDSMDTDKCAELSQSSEKVNDCQDSTVTVAQTDSLSSEGPGEVKELVRDSRLTSGSEDKLDLSDNSANDRSAGSGNDVPIFRFESDHCYAGLPRAISCSQSSLEEQSFSEGEEIKTPMDSVGEISQDSGYEDVTHSPEAIQSAALPTPVVSVSDPAKGLKTVKNLVPVLISVNNTGCLTLHSDPNISKQLGGQVLTVADSASLDKGSLKLIPGTNLTSIPQSPLILSPVGVKSPIAQVEPPPLVQTNAESILGLLRPTSPDPCTSGTTQEQTSPPKFGKFRIGTFASFSNTGMGMDNNKPTMPVKLASPQVLAKLPSSSRSRTNGVKSPPALVDTLGTLVQKVKSSLSPALSVDNRNTDHINHDHDYCLKSLVPSLVSSVLEAKLQKEAAVKGKVPHGKIKKSETEVSRPEGKLGKRKRSYSSMAKEDFSEDCDLEDDSEMYSQPEFIRPKTRAEKYIEQKSAEPKVKITGSSNFQDQFVYFMNTKKRSRRRESREIPIPGSVDRVFIPPKPGDIVVPHLSDQDIENLKKRSRLKQNGGMAALNSLRSEFMAAKLSNMPFNGAQSQNQQPETTVVDEKNIINTILSMENENLNDEPYNESMEMYGQGLCNDMMNFLPEQMNLTQEQMDLLYNAVDEVQNSSPGLVPEDEKLDSPEGEEETAFSQFVIPSTYKKPRSETCGIETAEEEISSEKQQEKASPGATPEENTEEADDKETSDDADASRAENVRTPELVPIPTDAADNESCAPSPTLSPDTKEFPGKTEEAKSAVEFSVAEPVATSSASSEPQRASPVPMDTTPSNHSTPPSLYTKASFAVVSSNNAENGLKPSLNSVNITNSLNQEIPTLPPLDRSSLDILGGEFRLDKSDLFSEPPVSVSGPMDTAAPWIVTVSMYWNDLPAIMITNQPYVRLVDIHKQILPAKDTGILKKRCQLMGIAVENCSEMQRYFLVQYGRAFNSKSTLIVSKDNAKELIGYYVDPQPKSSRIDDHKSIIDHRREQLRRIALARRAAIRARKVPGRREEDDPRAIRDEPDQAAGPDPLIQSMAEPVKPEATLTTVVPPITATPTSQTPAGSLPKRATRHKKINFLEMLRGDSSSQAPEEDTGADQDEHPKRKTLKHQESTESTGSAKKGRSRKNKVKIVNVKYTIQSESSETESNYTDSELSSSESTSGESEVMVIKKHSKHNMYQAESKLKSKAKMNFLKKQNRPALKVKIGTGKRSKVLGSSTPVAVQVVNKVLSPALPFYRSRLGSSDSRDSVSPLGIDTSSGNYQVYGKQNGQNSRHLTLGKLTETETNSNSATESADSLPGSFSSFDNNLYSKPNIPEFKKVIVEQINEGDMKIPTTLPDEILEEESKTREMETNTDFDVHAPDSSEEKVAANNQELDTQTSALDTSDSLETRVESVNEKNVRASFAALPHIDSPLVRSESPVSLLKGSSQRTLSTESLELDSTGDSCRSPTVTDGPLLIMKQKEREPINVQEAPLRILHRESSPLNVNRNRSQLGELFIEKYVTKKSMCIQCYTCRKMLSVDNFMRHLHDIVTGGLMHIDIRRTLDSGDTDMTDGDRKVWEAFQRKKELFDNNQLPSPDVQEGIFGVDSDSNHSLPENVNISIKPNKPRVITTPVSPVRKVRSQAHPRRVSVPLAVDHVDRARSRVTLPLPVDPVDGVRSSGRKRKKKQLYPFEEYTYTKFPRLHGIHDTKDSTSDGHQ